MCCAQLSLDAENSRGSALISGSSALFVFDSRPILHRPSRRRQRQDSNFSGTPPTRQSYVPRVTPPASRIQQRRRPLIAATLLTPLAPLALAEATLRFAWPAGALPAFTSVAAHGSEYRIPDPRVA